MLKYIAILTALSVFIAGCTIDTIDSVYQTFDPSVGLPLEDIIFLNDSTGYAVGGKTYNKGCIVSTSDAGNTWKVDTTFEHALWAISKNGQNETNAVGFSGNLFIKRPGEKWSFYRLPIWNELTGTLYDKSGGVFLSSGSSFKAGKIIHLRADYSVDTIFEMQNEIQKIAYSDDHSLVAVGYGAVFNSPDNGKSWVRNTLQGDYFRSVVFPEPKIGFVLGFAGSLFKTNDGGQTWEKLIKSGNLFYGQHSFLDMAFRNKYEGYICGQYGLLLKTSDGGYTWQKYERFTEDHLTAVCTTKSNIWISSSSGKMYKITN